MGDVVIAVHGGAGRSPTQLADEAGCHAGLEAALAAGHAVLTGGGAALDAVEAAVRSLEGAPQFNAGYGSVLNAHGEVEMDAAVMAGGDGAAGAVGAVRGVRHAVSLARAVLEEGRHVLLVGDGARELARDLGEACPEDELVTDAQRRRWRRRVESGSHGTVGAVALDGRGHVAAATSTGGMPHKRRGRVGDSAVIGAGTWADDETCAVSLTGDGEMILRVAAARELASLVAHRGLSIEQAAEEVTLGLTARGVEAGLIAVDRGGRVALSVNCALMHRGVQRGSEPPWTAIQAE